MSLHFLKIAPEYFSPLANGIKLFEIRKSDRDFKIGDLVMLEEFNLKEKKYTGRAVCVTIMYVLTHEDFPLGIKPGFCVMSVKLRNMPPGVLGLLAKEGSTDSSKEITNV